MYLTDTSAPLIPIFRQSILVIFNNYVIPILASSCLYKISLVFFNKEKKGNMTTFLVIPQEKNWFWQETKLKLGIETLIL